MFDEDAPGLMKMRPVGNIAFQFKVDQIEQVHLDKICS